MGHHEAKRRPFGYRDGELLSMKTDVCFHPIGAQGKMYVQLWVFQDGGPSSMVGLGTAGEDSQNYFACNSDHLAVIDTYANASPKIRLYEGSQELYQSPEFGLFGCIVGTGKCIGFFALCIPSISGVLGAKEHMHRLLWCPGGPLQPLRLFYPR